MLSTDLLRATFEAALPYERYVATGTPDQQRNWAAFDAQVRVTDPQRTLLAGVTRRVPVLVTSGVWCGDCVQQCPMFRHIQAANPAKIDVRFVDRDEHMDLAERVRVCGGLRVPIAVFMNEEFEFVSLVGDRPLSRYRAIAERKLGASCPLPGAPVPEDEIAATLQDWVNEFERVHLLLRLSPKLRQKHGD